MTNGEKILIGILLVILIAVAVGVFGNKKVNEVENNSIAKNEVASIYNYLNTLNEKDNTSVQNTENNVTQNNGNENVNQTQNVVVGKEEQESKKEDTTVDNKQKAIELAQKEWGISIESYDFQAELISGNIYRVTVISNDSNRTTVAIYTVDVDKSTVTE